MEQEIWKDIPWYEGKYQASNIGRIKNNKKYLLWNNNNGYLYINFYKKWKKAVHRLIASTFLWLDLNNRLLIICHKNDIKNDNRVSNLFIWTQKDNIKDMISKGRRVQWNHRKKVYMLDKNFIIIKRFNSIVEAQKYVCWSNWNISKCCNWKKKNYLWYNWKFI